VKKSFLVNDQIRESKINLVLEDGKMIDREMSVGEALEMAVESGVDLVQVSPPGDGRVSVCKLMNYGKIKYKKRKSEKHKKERVKEIRYSFNISDHDLETKHKKVLNILSKQQNVRYILELKGRQSGLIKEGREKIMDNLRYFEGFADWEEPKMSRNRSITRFSVILNFLLKVKKKAV
jgi:translation initiation factor IF-3